MSIMDIEQTDVPSNGNGTGSEYEHPGVFEGDVNFLNCKRCGTLVYADAENINRHNAFHVAEDAMHSAGVPPTQQERRNVGMDLAELIRETIRDEARRQGLRQVDLSKKTGVSQKHLSQMFTGNAVGSLTAWSKLASAMDRQWSITLVDD